MTNLERTNLFSLLNNALVGVWGRGRGTVAGHFPEGLNVVSIAQATGEKGLPLITGISRMLQGNPVKPAKPVLTALIRSRICQKGLLCCAKLTSLKMLKAICLTWLICFKLIYACKPTCPLFKIIACMRRSSAGDFPSTFVGSAFKK